MGVREWQLNLYRSVTGELVAGLYEVDESSGALRLVSDEAFGPFDTASDVSRWVVRHWAPRARLPLR